MMRCRGIDLVLDVGANTGQYARSLRRDGYRGRIVSFEPLPDAFSRLATAAGRDQAWDCHQVALGPADSRAVLNVAGNSVSSSLLPMLHRHLQAAPSSRYRGSVEVEVRALDSLAERLRLRSHRTHLKLDVQGYESSVLEGARRALELVELLELELSVVPLYEGQALFREMIDLLEERGFRLASLEPGFTDPRTGHLLQFDGVFEKVADA